ncbi:MAG TPA: Cmx/CmrA family chloramphenicol efflux MFS transporter [Streptosporangiaceae bacterium]|jgi:DHA1 family chloramphenicol resistance protein-like MFS transporter
MPIAVYVLGLSIFALGTTEFMISGLLPQIATDLGVSIPDAGLLVSGFALGMLVGAPVMAVLTLRLPRKVTLLAALGVFAAGQALGAVAPSYGALMAARVLTAVATGAFWAVGGVVATRLVPPERRGRALAVMVGGLTVANVVGVPLGTVVGEALGWRAGFWAVGALAALGFAGVAVFVPRVSGAEARPDLRAEVRAFASARIWAALATTAVVAAAIFGVFSYVAPLATGVTGLAPGLVPVVLMVFGVGGVLGVVVGGRVADAYPFRTLYWGLAGLAVVLALLGVAVRVPWAVLVLAGAFGVAGFVINPVLNGRVIGLAGDAPTLAASSSVSAFNTGNMLGPWLGGLVIEGFGTSAVPWLGAGLAALTVGVVGVSAVLERRHVREQAAAGAVDAGVAERARA